MLLSGEGHDGVGSQEHHSRTSTARTSGETGPCIIEYYQFRSYSLKRTQRIAI